MLLQERLTRTRRRRQQQAQRRHRQIALSWMCRKVNLREVALVASMKSAPVEWREIEAAARGQAMLHRMTLARVLLIHQALVAVECTDYDPRYWLHRHAESLRSLDSALLQQALQRLVGVVRQPETADLEAAS